MITFVGKQLMVNGIMLRCTYVWDVGYDVGMTHSQRCVGAFQFGHPQIRGYTLIGGPTVLEYRNINHL